MKDEDIVFQSIGIIHSPHKELNKIPIQPVFCRGIKGTIVLHEKYIDGLEGFSHIFLLYHFHGSNKTRLQLKPYLSDE